MVLHGSALYRMVFSGFGDHMVMAAFAWNSMVWYGIAICMLYSALSVLADLPANVVTFAAKFIQLWSLGGEQEGWPLNSLLVALHGSSAYGRQRLVMSLTYFELADFNLARVTLYLLAHNITSYYSVF